MKQWKDKDSYTRKNSLGKRSKVRNHKQRYSLTTLRSEQLQPLPQIHLGNCGVFGIYSQTGITRYQIDQFIEMMDYNKQRGSQATGVIIGPKENRKTQIGIKTPGDPTAFLQKYQDTLYKKAPGARFIVGHGRRATRGNPLDNRNNHPLRGNGFWLVHNGVVSAKHDIDGNPYVLVDHTKTDSFILIDTLNVALNEIPDKYEAVQKSYEWHRGGATVAIGFDDGDLIIVTRTNPMLYIRDNDMFYFAQQSDIFPKSMQIINIPNGFIMQVSKGSANFLQIRDKKLSEEAMTRLGVNWRTLSESFDKESEKKVQLKGKQKRKGKSKKLKQKVIVESINIKKVRMPSPVITPKSKKMIKRKVNMNVRATGEYYNALPQSFRAEMVNHVILSDDDFELLQWVSKRNNMDERSARNLIVYVDKLLATTG